MNSKDIRNAFKDRILSTFVTEPPVAWPNTKFDHGVVPRLEAKVTAAGRSGGTLKGNEVTRETGIFSVIVCEKKNRGEDDVLDTADIVANLFPEGLKMTITGGEIKIVAAPVIAQGYPDDDSYRVPVTMRYVATST